MGSVLFRAAATSLAPAIRHMGTRSSGSSCPETFGGFLEDARPQTTLRHQLAQRADCLALIFLMNFDVMLFASFMPRKDGRSTHGTFHYMCVHKCVITRAGGGDEALASAMTHSAHACKRDAMKYKRSNFRHRVSFRALSPGCMKCPKLKIIVQKVVPLSMCCLTTELRGALSP